MSREGSVRSELFGSPRRPRPTFVRVSGLALLLAVAAVSASAGATAILWIGSFHGSGTQVRALGILVGFAAGIASWRYTKTRLSRSATVATAVAVASVCAVLPTEFDQTVQLLHTYVHMSASRAEASGGFNLPTAQGEEGSFDTLRRAIPNRDTYILYGNPLYGLWVHYWLLPRIAVTSPTEAKWAIVHGQNLRSVHVHLTQVRRIDKSTWVARVAR